MPICGTDPTGSVGSAMMRRRMVCREDCITRRSMTCTPSRPLVARPMICTISAQPLGYTRERINERGETRGFDFSSAAALPAKVCADLDEQTNRLFFAWQVGDVTRVAAMHASRHSPTQRTTRRYLGRNWG